VAKGSKYAHWIGLYLGFHLSWVLGPFVHGRLQNLKTSEATFGHELTSLNQNLLVEVGNIACTFQNQHLKLNPLETDLQALSHTIAILSLLFISFFVYITILYLLVIFILFILRRWETNMIHIEVPSQHKVYLHML